VSALLIGAFAIAPSLVGRGTQSVLLTLLLFAAMAQAWNLIGGFGGQLSLGHAAFLGTGAYTTGMLILKAVLPLAVTLLLSGLAAAAFALVTSAALLRLRGVYFSIATLAVALAAQAWMVTWEYTGASKGLNLPISDLPDPVSLYYLALALTIALSLTAWWFSWSAFGLRVMAVRDDEDAARALGVNGTRIKVTVSTLSGFFTGLIGAVVALNQIALVPENLFDLRWTIDMVVMAMIGGLGTVAGPLVGAGVVYYLIEKQFENQPELAALLAGILVIAVIRFAPGGVWGLIAQVGQSRIGVGARLSLRAFPDGSLHSNRIRAIHAWIKRNGY
jgi:branched-chain amino acid transport system permease protein